MVTSDIETHFGKRSDPNLPRLLGEAIQQIEGLSAELDRTRAERDQLRVIVNPERKGTAATSAEAA